MYSRQIEHCLSRNAFGIFLFCTQVLQIEAFLEFKAVQNNARFVLNYVSNLRCKISKGPRTLKYFWQSQISQMLISKKKLQKYSKNLHCKHFHFLKHNFIVFSIDSKHEQLTLNLFPRNKRENETKNIKLQPLNMK